MAAELVREQLLRVARDELPHSIAVTVEPLDDDRRHDPRQRRRHPSARRHDPGGTGIPEGHRDRQGRSGAEGSVHERPQGARGAPRYAGVHGHPGQGRPRLAAPPARPRPPGFRGWILVRLTAEGRRESGSFGPKSLWPQVATARKSAVRVPRQAARDCPRSPQGCDAKPDGGPVPARGIEDMTNRSRRRRLVFVATGLVTLAILVAGCTGPGQRPELAEAQGRRRPEDRRPLHSRWSSSPSPSGSSSGSRSCSPRSSSVAARADDDRPKQIHGNTALEIGWTLIPAVILAVVAVPTVSLIFELNEAPEPNALEVTAVGKQWWWQFDYPAASKGDQKVVTANEMHVPVGREVNVTLTACDPSLPAPTDTTVGCNVIHSLLGPRAQRQARRRAGPRQQAHVHRRQAGHLSRAMRGVLRPLPRQHAVPGDRPVRERFQEWLAEQQEGPTTALDDAGEAGELFGVDVRVHATVTRSTTRASPPTDRT